MTTYSIFDSGLTTHPGAASRADATRAHDKLLRERFDRIDQLQRVLAEEGIDLPLDPSSLQPLNDWFVTQVETRDRTELERLEDEAVAFSTAARYRVEPGGDYTPRIRPTRRTESLVLDIMLFIGETLIVAAPHLFWTMITGPSNDVAYQRTVLSGFQNVRNKNYYCDLEGVLSSYVYDVAVGEPRVIRPTRDYRRAGEPAFWNINKFVHLYDTCLQIA